jgi:protease I
MAAKGKLKAGKSTKALMLLGPGFEDSEFFCPYYRLLEAGTEVDVAGPAKETITGKHGYTFKAELTFAEAARRQYDVLVIPGGKGPETVRLDRNAVQIAKDMVREGKLVAAICHGPQVLISADALRGRKATCWQGIRDDLKQAGATYRDAEVVADGNLITSRCPEDLPAFCREIFRALRS